MTDPLELVWPLVDEPVAMVKAHNADTWPAGVHQRLMTLGFLREAGTAESILCPECGNHVEEVFAIPGPGGHSRYVIHCPEVLRVVVLYKALRQWIVDLGQIARTLAGILQLSGKCTELATGRIWRLGRWTYQGVQRDLLLAGGLGLSDAEQYRRAISGAHRPVLFVGSRMANPDFWNGRIPPQILLSEVATLIEDKIEIDVTQIIGLVHAADEQHAAEAPLTRKQIAPVIRQEVKACDKSRLRDDHLVAAYKNFGSYTKAVTGLANQGYHTNRSAVERAVQRAGGRQAVIRGDDSESVVRTVSSRRRDTPVEKKDSHK